MVSELGVATQPPRQAAYAAPSVPAHSPSRRSVESPQARAPVLAPFPELDCLRRRLPVGVIAAAERRAREIDVGAERVLIASGAISEQDYVTSLAASLAVPIAPLRDVARADCPVGDDRLVAAAATGMLPVFIGGELALVVAPRNDAARMLSALARIGQLPERLMLTSTASLQHFIERHAADAIGRNAADALRNARPDLSAAPYRGQGWLPSLAVLALGAAAAWAAPAVTAAVIGVLLAVLFLAWTGLRLLGLFTRDVPPAAVPRQPSAELPTYTVIVALYREVAVVKRLVAALDALDYPREKLQTIFVVEPDDFATRSALDDMRLGPPYEIVVAPRIGPRTKPKALNVALARARGTFTAIFDAEDRPEPDQLRRAVAEFQRQGQQLACVQARLCIDNTADGWLTRLFTAEYCGQFDVFLPGLAARALPLPLGGSSNHFRTAVLREVGGWDPYNVTEDADLGMRLARCGYRTDMIASTTLEEAPARVRPWLHQRTRWFKGWLQTWLVHMRTPRRLLRELKAPGFLTFQLIVGGTVFAALVHPLFIASLVYGAAVKGIWPAPRAPIEAVMLTLYGSAFVAGYVASIALGIGGLARRKLMREAWVLVLVPVLWLLLSVAAWRALAQLICDPYRWEKTEHGLAKTSRSAAADEPAGSAPRTAEVLI